MVLLHQTRGLALYPLSSYELNQNSMMTFTFLFSVSSLIILFPTATDNPMNIFLRARSYIKAHHSWDCFHQVHYLIFIYTEFHLMI